MLALTPLAASVDHTKSIPGTPTFIEGELWGYNFAYATNPPPAGITVNYQPADTPATGYIADGNPGWLVEFPIMVVETTYTTTVHPTEDPSINDIFIINVEVSSYPYESLLKILPTA